MSGTPSSSAAGPAHELRQLSDLSPPAASSSGPPSVIIESETNARRPRPRGRVKADAPPPPLQQPALLSTEMGRDKHATKGGKPTSALARMHGDNFSEPCYTATYQYDCEGTLVPYFIQEPADVKRMEADLLRLMQGFSSGSLRAFGKDVSMEQMEQIREQQERLAKLHFEMGAQQELFPPLSEEGLSRASANLQQLMQQLQQLSTSIEKLHARDEAPGSATASATAAAASATNGQQEPPHAAG